MNTQYRDLFLFVSPHPRNSTVKGHKKFFHLIYFVIVWEKK